MLGEKKSTLWRNANSGFVIVSFHEWDRGRSKLKLLPYPSRWVFCDHRKDVTLQHTTTPLCLRVLWVWAPLRRFYCLSSPWCCKGQFVPVQGFCSSRSVLAHPFWCCFISVYYICFMFSAHPSSFISLLMPAERGVLWIPKKMAENV